MIESERKGIILAGGLGTRLHPLTSVVSKQLLPVYDKPMIYYSLSTLLLTGIRDILIITTPEALPLFKRLLGDGSEWGIRLSYKEQARPAGLAQALIIGEGHIDNGPSVLILGDNIFFGNGITDILRQADANTTGATIFSYRVSDGSAYGIVTTDENGKAIAIEEKPEKPQSNLAVTGLYFYDADAPEFARNVKPSSRGELEITSVNQHYLELGKLHVSNLYRGFVWFDAGTIDMLVEAANFIRHIEARQGQKIACPEEICLSNGWIDGQQIRKLAEQRGNCAYGQYLHAICDEHRPLQPATTA